MTIQIANGIKRFNNGTIDYNYYSSIGRQARNHEIKPIPGWILNLTMRSVKVLPVVIASIILNFVLQ